MKVYAVIKEGGEWEDSWQEIVGICPTAEIAEAIKVDIEEYQNRDISITENEWYEMYNAMNSYEEDHEEFNSVMEGMTYLFPQYSENEIQEAMDRYDAYDHYVHTVVKEIEFFNSLSDYKNGNNA